MASKRRNVFQKNKTQETTENECYDYKRLALCSGEGRRQMVLVWLALLSSALGRCYAESEYGNWTEVESGRDYGGVGHVPDLPQPNGYQLYDRPGGQYDKWPLHTFTSPIVGVVGAALLVKLPLLMLIKLALMKTAVPVALALTVAPLILPLLYELILKPSIGDESPSMSQGDTESTTTSSPLEMMMGRHRRDGDGGSFVVEFLRSPDCLKKIACTLGAEHAAAGYDEAIF
ncbi:hypothetical protein AAG570_012416 [Ranatra chinensis]|uniref:Uncharacterized protein n=1 Tax=Ranatra chinensis TaxID=642074 RepID=A0ABD0YIR8_9HEMI